MSKIEEDRARLEAARGCYGAGLSKVHEGHDHLSARNGLVPRRKEVKAAALEIASRALNSILGAQNDLDILRKLFSEGASISRSMEVNAIGAADNFTDAEALAQKASELILAVDDRQEYTTPPIDSASMLKDAATTSAIINGKANEFCFSSRQAVDEIDRGLADVVKGLKSIVDQIPSHDQATHENRREMSHHNETPADATTIFTHAINSLNQQINDL